MQGNESTNPSPITARTFKGLEVILLLISFINNASFTSSDIAGTILALDLEKPYVSLNKLHAIRPQGNWGPFPYGCF